MDRNRILTPRDLAADLPEPPRARRQPAESAWHGRVLRDDYAWLRDPGYPEVSDEEVLAHLRAENAYFEAAMAPHAELVGRLQEELRGRMKEDDESVPFRDGDWLYGWRYAEGAQYPTWYRRPASEEGTETVILDELALAAGRDHHRVGILRVSDDGHLLAWSEDDEGSERYVLRVKDLRTGEVLPDAIENTIGGVAWSADSRSILYLELSEQWRPVRVRCHRLGTDPAQDPVLYEERDDGYFLKLGRTRSRSLIVISTGDHVTSEVRLLPAADPLADAALVAERESGHEYSVDEADGRLFVLTNDTHADFRIATAPVESPGRERWTELVAGDDRTYLRGMAAFRDHLVLEQRRDGLEEVRIRRHDGEEWLVDLPERACSVSLGTNLVFDTSAVRLAYESMVTPPTVFDYDVDGRRLETLKVQEIPSGYDREAYVTERLSAPARDGAAVPVSLVRRRDRPADASSPVHLYGYGAYAHGIPPRFSLSRISLLDRGFTYAIAHVRGGDELGRRWYEGGKLERRANTFHDFVDVARFLVAEGLAEAGSISISGGSAGGELVGAVLNEAPELWRAAVAHVPFVDVLHTLLDATLPLTPIEWPEWGDPREDAAAFELIRSYSPYDNVEARAYPPMLVTAGLHDPRVTYWEPAKWVAKLRAMKTDDNVLLLKTNMDAGHGGKTGRFDSLREIAEEQAFLLLAFGLPDC